MLEAERLPAEGSPTRTGRGWIWVLVVMIVGGLLATGSWWITHPNALRPTGRSGVQGPVSLDEAHHSTHIVRPLRPIQIKAVRPHNAGGAAAAVSFHACLRRQPNGSHLLSSRSVRALCEEVGSVEGLVVYPVQFGQQHPWSVLVRVALLEPGRFEMHGFEVEYRDGIRRGRQVTGMYKAVYTPGHEPPDR